jgi:hypothetical protein
MKNKRSSRVTFVVQYGNGQKHHILIDRDALKDGDHVALSFAQK